MRFSPLSGVWHRDWGWDNFSSLGPGLYCLILASWHLPHARFYMRIGRHLDDKTLFHPLGTVIWERRVLPVRCINSEGWGSALGYTRSAKSEDRNWSGGRGGQDCQVVFGKESLKKGWGQASVWHHAQLLWILISGRESRGGLEMRQPGRHAQTCTAFSEASHQLQSTFWRSTSKEASIVLLSLFCLWESDSRVAALPGRLQTICGIFRYVMLGPKAAFFLLFWVILWNWVKVITKHGREKFT